MTESLYRGWAAAPGHERERPYDPEATRAYNLVIHTKDEEAKRRREAVAREREKKS